MKKAKRILGSLLSMILLSTLMTPAVSYGAASAISSVSLRVGLNDFEAGDSLPDIEIGDRNASDCAYVYESSSYYDIYRAQWVTSSSRRYAEDESLAGTNRSRFAEIPGRILLQQC